MKKIIFVFSILIMGFSTQAQEVKEVKKNKNAKVIFEVDGICGMCKKRIEGAALKTPGVKFALWNVESHQLNLIMDERKTDVAKVKKSILEVGHDVIGFDKDTIRATDKAYDSVHACCKYRDEEIVKDHEGELKKIKKN